ncbi:MAG: hypothetical protein KGO92_00370 [Bacteroidota bacterium]|nr:hypothetical protein [Bacteroidota bacterium]
MEEIVDLVYILGNGSVWNNNELRFSLRSVEKNLQGAGKIYIVGERPSFLSDQVIHIPFPDMLGRSNADGNMALKILRACQEPALTENFLFMNDDFIINKPVKASTIPWLHKGDMKNHTEGFWKSEAYRKRLHRTFKVLLERGLPTLQYDYHAPMLMNKRLFPQCMDQFNFQDDIGYTFRSLYGNFYKLPAELLAFQKKTVYHYYTLEQLHLLLARCVFVGYNDNGLNDSFHLWMYEKFPEISRFETSDCDDLVINISRWLNTGMEYQSGVQLLKKFVKNRNLLFLMEGPYSKVLHEKLIFKLKLRLLNL